MLVRCAAFLLSLDMNHEKLRANEAEGTVKLFFSFYLPDTCK